MSSIQRTSELAPIQSWDEGVRRINRGVRYLGRYFDSTPVLKSAYRIELSFDLSFANQSLRRVCIQDAIDAAPHKRLEEVRVTFYAAEITLALFHLHDMGLMYRYIVVAGGTSLMTGNVVTFARLACLSLRLGSSLHAVSERRSAFSERLSF